MAVPKGPAIFYFSGSIHDMKPRQVFPVIFLLLCSGALVAQRNSFILQSVWCDSLINIDGSPEDWDQPFRYFDSKSKIQYSVVNDARFLYLSVRTTDDKAQMKILRAGMEVSIDASGKKKEMATIMFPLKSNAKLETFPDPEDPDKQKIEHPDIKKLKVDWVMSSHEARSNGLKSVPLNIGVPDSNNKYGVQAAINWDRSDVLTYELKVPFSLFYKETIAAADTMKPVSITVRVHGMDLPMIPTATAGGGTDITGPAGGVTAGNMNSGIPGQMNNNSRPQTSSPQPAMVIPPAVADMGLPLVVQMKMRLSFRNDR